jgi:hypothetical protein
MTTLGGVSNRVTRTPVNEIQIGTKLHRNLSKLPLGKLEHLYQLAKDELKNYEKCHTTEAARQSAAYVRYTALLQDRIQRLADLVRERH